MREMHWSYQDLMDTPPEIVKQVYGLIMTERKFYNKERSG
jgi:hypothetical protein